MAEIQNPGIAVQARPTGTFTRVETPQAFQLAEALNDLNPKLSNYLVKEAEDWADEQLQRGRQQAIEDAADWQRRTVRGEERLGHNHWYRRAYRQQAGQNEGRRIATEAAAAYANWEGRDSDNPNDFPQWLAGFIRERTDGVNDPDVLAGLTPELGILTNNLGNAHTAYTAERVEREGNDALTGAVLGAIGQSRDGPLNLMTGEREGDFSPQALLDQYTQLRDTFYASGMNRTRFDAVFTQAVIDASIADLDTSYLEVLSMPRGNGVPPISEKAGMQQVIADTVNQIESRAAGATIRAAQQQAAEREIQAQSLFQRVAMHLVQGGEMTPELRQEVALAGAMGVIDVGAFQRLNEAWRAGIDAADNPVFAQSVQDMPAALQMAVYANGDVRALVSAYNSGVITDPGLFAEMLRAAVSRREGEENQDISRAGLGMRIADEERSAVSRTLLPVFNNIYGTEQTNAENGRAMLGRVMDQYRPHREALIDGAVSRYNTTPTEAATKLDGDVSAYINGEISVEDFEATWGENSRVALRPFSPAWVAQNGRTNRN